MPLIPKATYDISTVVVAVFVSSTLNGYTGGGSNTPSIDLRLYKLSPCKLGVKHSGRYIGVCSCCVCAVTTEKTEINGNKTR